jgi:Trypsin-co-occurring domain 1
MAEILVEVRPSAAAGDLTGQPAIPEAFMNRVEDLGKSLKEIAERLSQQLEDFEKKRAAAAWHLDRVELKFSLDLEAEAGVVIARTKTSAGFEASLSWKSSSA